MRAPNISAPRPFFNQAYGDQMAQAVAFSGTPVTIHNGGDVSAWSGVGAAWNFADATNPATGSACVSITGASNGDTATFTGSAINGANYVAFTMQLRLETWSPANNGLFMQCYYLGAPVGNSVDLSVQIDETVLNAYQTVVVTSAVSGVTSNFDEIRLTVTRSGGPAPTLRFDDFQIEETGGSITFTATPQSGSTYELGYIRLVLKAAVTGNAALDDDKLLNATLAIGFTIDRVSRGRVIAGRNFKSILELEKGHFNEVSRRDNGTNTTVVMEVEFEDPPLLIADEGDNVSITINDTLTPALLSFSGTIRGPRTPI